jgi:phospholipase/carboxylesterase
MSTTAEQDLDSITHLKARPAAPSTRTEPGVTHLRLRNKRQALLSVPEAAVDSPRPFVVMLHGAGGNAEQALALLGDSAEKAGIIVLAPESRKSSWDIISDAQYGPDVRFIDEALRNVFSTCTVDPQRIGIGGFSDGASYALSLGLSNGALFHYILAFSPGFMAPVRLEDRPLVFISHGAHDNVLPIDRCSRKLVRVLRQHDLPLLYREFEGPHTIPPEIKQEAIDWFLAA